MPNHIRNIVERINQLQEELEVALGEKAEQFSYSIENQRIKFKSDTIKWQKQFKLGLPKYILGAPLLHILSAPVIYSLVIPFIIIDLWISLYQAICFPIYGVKKVRRRDYITFDRRHLAYLNIIEKLNCAYCSYGNGLLSYCLEVAARTEAYWCPIKHANKMRAYHKWYGGFSEYGDAENYQADRLRNIAAVSQDDNSQDPAE
ncbi:MAG: hypothetical protein COA53_04350 [Rhodobacteraceae bacterium]|nr:MAG: hypothetical protein COA53_04350 [Paracoccaceae bacterium]